MSLKICLLLSLLSFHNLPESQQRQPFDWQGHRGCRGLYPENTIPAMLHAIDLGVSTLEMDVVISSDKQVICSHDPYFNRDITTKPDGTQLLESEDKKLILYQMTYADISRYDVGMKVHPKFQQQKKIPVTKPKLADLIDSAENYLKAKRLPAVSYNIETKSTAGTDGTHHPPPAEFVELLMSVIKDKHIERRTIIQSFDVRTLQYLHQKYPHIKTAFLVEDPASLQQQLAKLGFTPTIYSPAFALVTPKLVNECRERGMKVIPWTVNEVSKMKGLKQMGVDGIITDYPNLIF